MPQTAPKGDSRVPLTVFRFALPLILLTVATAARAQTITEYPIPTPGVGPVRITAGPDGNLWFTEFLSGQIGRIMPGGVVTEFSIPGSTGLSSSGIVTGPDGNLWFTLADFDLGQVALIGRITTAGAATQFLLSNPLSSPYDIAAGPDGNLWFTEANVNGNRIGRITTAGVITEFPLSPPGWPSDITAGPDGSLWFTHPFANKIGRITTGGIVTEFAIPTASSGPSGITAGADGNLWFTEHDANTIGRITTAGIITEFPVPTSASQPRGISAGPDGNLWFTEEAANKIGRITTAGVITEFSIPTPGSRPIGITAGADGNLWFTEYNANKIGRVTVGGISPTCTPDEHTLCLNNGRFAVTASFQLTPSGPSIEATGVRLTGDSGYFWFFDPDNVELVVKVLNGCVDPFNSYWVFAAGLTNVGVVIQVTDTLKGGSKTYENPLGTPFQPIQDTRAFGTCP
jgi:streptogramin lyase